MSRYDVSFLRPVTEDYCSLKQTNEKQWAFNKLNRPWQNSQGISGLKRQMLALRKTTS